MERISKWVLPLFGICLAVLLASCSVISSPPPAVTLEFCTTYIPDYTDNPTDADIHNNAVYFEMCE